MRRQFIATALLLVPAMAFAGETTAKSRPTIALSSVLFESMQDQAKKEALERSDQLTEINRLREENVKLTQQVQVSKPLQPATAVVQKLRAPRWFPDRIREYRHKDFGHVLTATVEGRVFVSTAAANGADFAKRFKTAILKQAAVGGRNFYMLDGSKMSISGL